MQNIKSITVFLALLSADISEGYVMHASSSHLRSAGNDSLAGLILGQPDAEVAESEAQTGHHTTSGEMSEQKPIVTKAKTEKSSMWNDLIKGKSGSWALPKNDPDANYPLLHFCHQRLEYVFGKGAKIWWKDWKLWIGFIAWLVITIKWASTYFQHETFCERGLFAFAVNIMILHALQYAANAKVGMLYVNIFLAVQNLVQAVIHYQSGHASYKIKQELICDTLYLDLVKPLAQIVVLFIAQVCVWWFYMTSILFNFDSSHVNYAFWLVAYLVMQMTMIFNRGSDSVLGAPFPVDDVVHMIKHAGHVRVYEYSEDEKRESEDQVEPFTITQPDVIARSAMGFICNSILRDIMSYTIPLMLMGFTEPMDFVVYCVGVNFICTVDDMPTTKTYMMKDYGATEVLASQAVTED